MSQMARSQSVKVNLDELWDAVTDLQGRMSENEHAKSAVAFETIKDMIQDINKRIAEIDETISLGDNVNANEVSNLADISVRLDTIEKILWGTE